MHLNNQPNSVELNTANSKLRTLWLQISDVVSLKIIVITFEVLQHKITLLKTQLKLNQNLLGCHSWYLSVIYVAIVQITSKNTVFLLSLDWELQVVVYLLFLCPLWSKALDLLLFVVRPQDHLCHFTPCCGFAVSSKALLQPGLEPRHPAAWRHTLNRAGNTDWFMTNFLAKDLHTRNDHAACLRDSFGETCLRHLSGVRVEGIVLRFFLLRYSGGSLPSPSL